MDLPQDPIFIVGFPRSGTTLLQAMLAAQSHLYSFPETHYFGAIYKSIRIDDHGCVEQQCLPGVFEKLREKVSLEFEGTEKDRIISMALDGKLSPKDLFEEIVSYFLLEQNELSGYVQAFRWIEKTPNHVYFLDRIFGFYPQAQFINIIRNPILAIQSRKKNFPFNRETPVTTLAQLWVKSVVSADDFSERHPEKLFSLRYEDLVNDPVKTLRNVCDFLEVGFEPDRVKGYKTVSRNLIHPWEGWKSDVASRDVSPAESPKRNEFGVLDLLRIQNIAGMKMKQYRYPLSIPLPQKFFDYFAAAGTLWPHKRA